MASLKISRSKRQLFKPSRGRVLVAVVISESCKGLRKTLRSICALAKMENPWELIHSVMEVDVPVENLQDGANEPGQVVIDCLGLPEILRKVMQYFSTTELLELSVVNKQWNYEARSLMKSRGNLIARLGRNDTCQVLQDFASDLQEMKEPRKVVPFSGLEIALAELNQRSLCTHSSSTELVQVYKDVLNQVTWKHLSLTFAQGWEKQKTCPPFLLVEKILEKYSGVLEELALRIESTQGESIEQLFQNCSFTRLKTLRFLRSNGSSRLDYLCANFIKALVSIAPNLQEIYTEDRINVRENLLEGSSAVLVLNFLFYAPLDRIPECVMGQLRLQKLHLIGIRNFSVERFSRITSALFQSSRTTLNFMLVDIMFLIPLTLFGISLENLKHLEINLMYSHLEESWPRVLRLAKYFDFTRIFPNLGTVIISSSYLHRSFASMANGMNDMVDQGHPAFESVPDRAINIKNLSLKWQSVTELHSTAPFLAEMFPDIEKLSIETDEIPFAYLWNCWPELKELEITLSLSGALDMELDSALCGIFPQEVAQLKEKDEEYLKAVNIVPVMPSIACITGLRTFKLVCDVRRPHSYDPSYLLSKVTGLIAFQRCPDLTVTVATNNKELEEALSPMKPYASVLPF